MKIWRSSNFSSAFLQKQTVVLWTEISRYLYSECETLPREWVKALLATLSGNVTPAGSGPVSAVSMAMPGGISVCLQKASLCFRPAASCRGWNPSWSQYRGERSGSHRSPIPEHHTSTNQAQIYQDRKKEALTSAHVNKHSR